MENQPSAEFPDVIQAPPPPSYDNEKFWSMLVHLTALTGFVSFVGFFLGPLVVWLIQKERFPGVTAHFKEAINFQISLALFALATFLAVIVSFGLGLILAIPVWIGLGVMDLVFPILAAIAASEGRSYRYPLTIRLVT